VSGGPRGNNVQQDKEAIVIVKRVILDKRSPKNKSSAHYDSFWSGVLEEKK
jgi:hypothetical protein